VAAGLGGDAAAIAGELATGLGDGLADGRADLDLAAQELRRDAVAEEVAASRHEGFRRIGAEVTAGEVDQQIFFLNADGGVLGHERSPRRDVQVERNSIGAGRRSVFRKNPRCRTQPNMRIL
jgi:hypothetical protein